MIFFYFIPIIEIGDESSQHFQTDTEKIQIDKKDPSLIVQT